MAFSRLGSWYCHRRSRGKPERPNYRRYPRNAEASADPGRRSNPAGRGRYQMLADADRGLNYELAMALAPARTQLLLLSGSVANPQDIVKWLHRLGRDAVLVRSDHRPVPLDEVSGNSLSYHLPAEIRGYWPR